MRAARLVYSALLPIAVESPMDRSLFAPRYWLTWLGMGLLRLLAALPYRLAMRAGDGLGLLSWYLVPYRRRIVETNLRLCFPDLTAAQRRDLARRNLCYTGRGLVEVALAWWGAESRIARLGTVEGAEHVARAQAEGHGVILVSAHFTPLDISGRIMSRWFGFQAIYRENRNAVIEHFMRESRRRHFEHAFDRGDMRAMVRALRERRVVWYPPDQDYGRRHAVFAPFFGVPAATITMTSRLARLSGAVVIPCYGVAREDGSGYVVKLGPPLEGFPSGDDTADAERLNARLEAEVRQRPAQYYWVHRRFKTRPDGGPSPYRGRGKRRRKGK
ncbi:LpxL/LpxP family Kdo(2)-lipid IV(A) lauroyl/palmitoleoyl acyltransferase [Arhodomonas sp. KWT2]|uniref:LpxL/LpxP family Kdo(2)-lipid IV(A) lauroyl/palmitoleoyl acyltransferase n=2 Tax=unclassified Arhodomonas TaxID=2621637 RepID=UPI0035BFBF77